MPELNEGAARFWDVLTKVVGGVVAILTLFIGFRTLYDQGETTRKQLTEQYEALKQAHTELQTKLEEEYHRRFWEKRLDLYSEASNAASSIATLKLFPGKDFPQDDYVKALRRFYELYYGALCIVESKEVETAMIGFKNALEANHTPESDYVSSLLNASLNLAYACSTHVQKDWKIENPGLRSPDEVSKESPLREVPNAK
jgi:hypothetical protein